MSYLIASQILDSNLFYFESPLFLLFFIISSILGVIIFLLTFSLGTPVPILDIEKSSVYECGFAPFKDTRKLIDIGFYKIAVLFLVFDLEIVFLVPWCVTFILSSVGLEGFLFLIILLLGLFYEYFCGALKW